MRNPPHHHGTSPHRRARRGFSIVELLIVVIVTTIGFVALFQLQANTLRGLDASRRMAEATNLAENFLEQLRLEFTRWTGDAEGTLASGPLYPRLAGLPIGAAAAPGAQTPGDPVEGGQGWVIGDGAQSGDDRRVSIVGDLDAFLGFNTGAHSAMVDPGVAGDAQQPFCLLYRLTWLIPNEAIRAEVEVSWALENANLEAFARCDEVAANRLAERRSVTLTTTLTRNLFRR